jgi:hypothetical protein
VVQISEMIMFMFSSWYTVLVFFMMQPLLQKCNAAQCGVLIIRLISGISSMSFSFVTAAPGIRVIPVLAQEFFIAILERHN